MSEIRNTLDLAVQELNEAIEQLLELKAVTSDRTEERKIDRRISTLKGNLNAVHRKIAAIKANQHVMSAPPPEVMVSITQVAKGISSLKQANTTADAIFGAANSLIASLNNRNSLTQEKP